MDEPEPCSFDDCGVAAEFYHTVQLGPFVLSQVGYCDRHHSYVHHCENARINADLN